MTASWVTQLSMEPVLIGVGVDNDAVTHRLITDGGSFTVNLWDAEDTKVFVKFSKPATDDGSTSQRPAGARGDHGRAGLRRGDRVDGLPGAPHARPRHPHPVRRRGRRRRDPRRRGSSRIHERHPHEVRRREAPLAVQRLLRPDVSRRGARRPPSSARPSATRRGRSPPSRSRRSRRDARRPSCSEGRTASA